MMKYINITLESYNILIGIIFFIYINFYRHLYDKVQVHLKSIVLVNILMAASDIGRLTFTGTNTPLNNIAYPVSILIVFLTSFAILVAIAIEIEIFTNQKKGRTFLNTTLIVTSAIFLTLLIINPFTHFLYKIETNNTIKEGPLYILYFFLEAFLYIALFIYFGLNIKKLSKPKIITVIIFILLPQIAQIIQKVKPGISLVPTAFTINFIIMFMVANRKLEESLDYTEFELDEKALELDEKISEIQHSKLEFIKMQNHTIESLSNLVENRDEDTGEHVRRTRAYVELLAVQLMKNNKYSDVLNPRYVRFLKRAAPMHDIGKIVVPDAILKKPGRLTEEEFEQMKRHASEGGRIVHEILDGYEDPEYIQITANIAKHHHEKWNGTGYPDKLKGEEIPLCARIMAIADVFDALVSPRIYKSPMSYEEAFNIIKEGSSIHFDPVIAEEFLNIKEKASAVNESFKGTM